MKKNFNALFLRLSLVAFGALAFGACKRQLSAKKMTQHMAAFVYAYSSGTVAKDQAVRVRFTSPIVRADEIGKSVESGIFNLTPSVSGNAIWEDPQTIRFTPEKGYKSGETYVGAVRLKRLFKTVPSDAETFEFDFRARELYFEVNVDGIQPDNQNDMSRQDLIGDITTSDRANDADVEKILSAKQGSNSLKINWIHAPDGQHHVFHAKEVLRGQAASKVDLAWSGKALDIDTKGEKTVEIPAIGSFVAMSARVVQDAEQYIKINFSDPLSTTGDVNGLIKIVNAYDDGNLRTAVDGNSILVYPTERIVGEHAVTVANGIKNYRGEALSKPETFSLVFSDIKPEVRLMGRGVILPSSDGLNFPFEAINLNYVDVEIVKIFNNNILQFLQANDLEGQNDLERVGRIIALKRIELKSLNANASTTKWTRYGLDLATLIKQDPTAIYQVRIGFRKNYSNYTCTTEGSAKDDLNGMTLIQNTDLEEDAGENWESQKSIWRYDFNSGESNGEYNYQDRSNPCKTAYYNNEHFARRNVFASDLGIIAKKGGDNSIFVAVSDLKTTYPRGSVKLDVYDYQQQIIGSAITNSDGVAVLKDIKGKAWMVVATVGNQKGYLPLSDNNALNLSRFDVAGETTQKGLKGFLYGERGVWRPGDSLHLNFMLEDKDNKLPDDYPVTLELYDPRGTLQLRTTTVENVKNIYPFHVSTRSDAPTGTWRADVKAGGATFTQPLKIETVKPNRLKINLDFAKNDIAAGENITGNLQVNWLHGAPARSAKVKIDATLVPTKTAFPKYKEFAFDDPFKSYKGDPSVIFENNVDENGNAKLNAALPKTQEAAGKMKIGLKIRAFEPSGDFSSSYRELDYSPYNTYVGVAIPINKQNEPRLDIGKNNSIAVLAVDKSGNPLRGRQIEVNVYRVEWRWWWETGDDDEGQFTAAKNMKPLTSQKLMTNADGTASIDVKPDRWGRYFVHVKDPLSTHTAGNFFYSGYPWDEGEQAGLSRNNAAMLSFSANKEKYAVGETVELNIPTPEGAKALISIENGAKVIESKWIPTKSGMTKYTFKATSEMSPTVYAFVTLVQPHNSVKNDLPIRMFGVAPVNVEDPKTHLEPIVKMPEVLKPEDKVTVEVKEKNGRAMAYTIAIVDDGLLDLTRFETPNPWKTFYARAALGVQTFDVYDQVLGAYGGQLERILQIGGDKAGKPKNAFNANRFKPVVMNFGPFYSSGGTQRHTFTMPNYVGSVRAMVVATDGAAAYGSGEMTAKVQKPLMVIATLPRVLSPNERLKLPVDVFAMSDKVKNATVSVVENSGLIAIQGSKTRNVSFDKPSDKMVDFDIVVNEGVGVAKFQVVAEGSGERSTAEIEIDVRNPNPVVTTINEAVIQAGQSAPLQYAGVGTNGTNEATLEISTMPPIDLASRLQYLLQYPYGCVEQTTSAAFPQLYVEKLMNLDENAKKQIATNVRAAIERLKMFQTADGGFGYWQGEDFANSWATNYVGHFLLEAKNAGYALPPNMLERWTKAQQTAAKRWTATPPAASNDPNTEGYGWDENGRDLTQAYRLYALAMAKTPENAAMNALREKKNLNTTARWMLASAYATTGKVEIGRQLINGAATSVNKYRDLSYTYGSELRDQAVVLESQVLLQNTSQALQIAREVSQKLSSGDWYGTQSVAYGLMAMSKFAGKSGGGPFTFSYDINGKSGNFTSQTPVAQIKLPANGSNTVTIRNTSKTQIFARLILRGQPAVGTPTQFAASNLNMNIQYKTLKGEPLNVTNIRQGTDFVAEVTVGNTGSLGKNYKELALAQVFPSGWEIGNSRMEKVQGYTNTSVPRYQDIRDDRVNTFFDLAVGKQQTYRIQLNAAYIGRFWLPTQQCEAMYDNSISAKQGGFWVDVSAGERKAM